MTEILKLAQTYGFPIVMCVVLIYYCKYLWDMFVKLMNNTEEKYEGVIKSQQDLIENNTKAMTALTENIRNLAKEVSENDRAATGD